MIIWSFAILFNQSMIEGMQTSLAGIELIKSVESLRLSTYDDKTGKTVGRNDKVFGQLTNGYGHTGFGVYAGQTVEQSQAETWLLEDLHRTENGILAALKVPVSQNQFDAMVCLAYNIGTGAFARSTLVRKLNAGDVKGAAEQFSAWAKNPKLKSRRAIERALFEKG